MAFGQQPRRAAKQYEGEKFAVEPRRARMVARLDERKPAAKAPPPKIERRVRQDIRDAANGEECTVRITGACNHRTDTTVGAHWPGLDGDRGMAMKAFDLCIAFACSGCHDVIDMRAPLPPGATRESVELDYHRGHLRTLVRLGQKGLL